MPSEGEFDLQEELQNVQNPSDYEIPHEHDPSNEDPARLLEVAVESTAESSDTILHPEIFDIYRSLLKHIRVLPTNLLTKLLDSICSGFQSELDGTVRDIEDGIGQDEGYARRKVALEMYGFLLAWFSGSVGMKESRDGEDGPAADIGVVPAKGKRGGRAARGGRNAAGRKGAAAREGWNWADHIPQALALVSKVLRVQTQRIWTTTAERDTFVSCLVRPAYHVTESEQYMKVHEIKMAVYKVICLAVKHHGHSLAVQIHIIQSLQFYEHLSEPMAECLSILAKEFDHAQLGDEILREIAQKTFNAQDNKGPRAFAKFLVKFAELAPRSVLKQLSLLSAQLDSDSYPMRIALVEVIGHIIIELSSSIGVQDNSSASATKQIVDLYDTLLERMLDLSSYVRTKVINVLIRLCDMKHKFPKQRLAVTEAAVVALEDKVTSVRKAAVALLVKLLATHPYGIVHGGHLAIEEFQEGYNKVKEELDKLESSLGKSVETQDGEEDEDTETEGGKKKHKKGKKSQRDEDGMDVDGGGDTEPEDDDDEEEDEDQDEDEDAMAVDEGDEPESSGRPKKSKKGKGKLKPRKSQIDVVAMNNEQAALAALESNTHQKLKLRKKYYTEALAFIREIEGAMEKIVNLLASTSKPEVQEAIEFFRMAHEYRFESAKVGIKKMIHLVWSKDNNAPTTEDGKELKGIRPKLLECYRSLYFDPVPDLDAKAQINRIAKNMIERTYDATLAELTSLEEMMRIMMDEGQVHQDVVTRLWKVYSSDKNLPQAQRRGTILILGMLALAKRSVLNNHVDTMLRVGLGPLGKADILLARYTCIALQRLNGSAKKVKGSLLDNTVRYDIDNQIFHKLREAIEHPSRSRDWFGLAEQAINTVYALGEHPDVFCDDLVKRFTRRAFARKSQPKSDSQDDGGDGQTQGKGKEKEKDPDAMDEDEPSPTAHVSQGSSNSGEDGKKDVGDAFELSQLVFIVGHVAIKQIVFLELVEREWKRQKDEKTVEKQAKGGDKGPSKDLAEELDQVAGNAEDEIGDRIAAVREHELLYGPDSLLAVYGPMIVHICGSPHKFKNQTLRAAATLSFSKFLCVSSQFCDQHHRLLFKILETSRDASIRSNIVIALGDVAVSFSNIIDENSNELYKGLSDKDLVVKKNTLMVLTHLILNGMIKVKGQLGEMAKCLEDPESRIADLAKMFFSELSTKENAIYNNLPDVISHLSVGDHAVDEETFQSTLKYIFQFIEKEKQAENIVEKLCQRFRLTDDPRQWRDIAFCLSLLPFKSDRSVKKLIEGLQYYRDKLHEPVVYERFTEILTKARSNKSKDKPDSELNEFEKILEEHRRQGEEDEALQRRVEGKKAAVKKRATRKTTRKKVQEQPADSD
ncbi:hypothetical protein BDN72DRAFT_257566 [Pluteus cervinus]|uniref:Uncharacterized protein n=1 Tax=Pluteus cervinus TaxID=181527 RepID=A0ACD3B7S0_9AGAR|nr:hypothetical protein BDN72DRAFT_257566 [Pluteus cervinus]